MKSLVPFFCLVAICASTPIYQNVWPNEPIVRSPRQFGGGFGGGQFGVGGFGGGGGWDNSNQNLDIGSQRGFQDFGGLGGFGGDQYSNTDIDYSRSQSGGQFGGGGFGAGGGFGGGGFGKRDDK